MKTKTTQTLLVALTFSVGLLGLSPVAGATVLENTATYSVSLSRVQSPNTPSAYVPGASATQRSSSYAPYLSIPVPVTVAGSANTGTNMDGYGYAVGHGFARAEAGVLAASALAEGQAVANATTNVGAGATVNAVARYTDLATFTPVAGQNPWQNLLIVSGNLLLTGNMVGIGYNAGYYTRVKVGGTGLAQSAMAEWIGEPGRQKSAGGVYSSWTPGSPTSIPFSFAVYGGQPTELSYWLDVYASAGASFPKCVGLYGPVCATGQVANSIANADYSHTLAWGGVNVTDWFGRPISFSTISKSGFNYAVPYTAAPVPEPETYALLLAGLGLVGFTARRRSRGMRA